MEQEIVSRVAVSQRSTGTGPVVAIPSLRHSQFGQRPCRLNWAVMDVIPHFEQG